MNLTDLLRTAALALRKLGPYALLEVLLPGGTVLALLLYLYRRRCDRRAEYPRSPVDCTAGCSS
jgi:hypothetical protein